MSAQRILVMGLPGSGKTLFAEHLKKYIEENTDISIIHNLDLSLCEIVPSQWKAKVQWFNADEVRKKYNDWDFSTEGRIRQSLRMLQFSLQSQCDYVICDFVAPLQEMRNNYNADWTIWMDTIDKGIYQDTNSIFVPPAQYDFRITEKNTDVWVPFVGNYIIHNKRRPIFDYKKTSAQLLGRYQPWHQGHRTLFEKALEKEGQVYIMVRDCHGLPNNPFTYEQIKNSIKRDLDPLYQGQYEISLVPNITRITYGRDVGYVVEKEILDDDIQSISATKIRKQMGIN